MASMLKDIDARDKEFVKKQEHLGLDDPNHPVFWADDDDFEESELAEWADLEQDCSKELDWQAIVRDGVAGDFKNDDDYWKNKRNLTAAEVKIELASGEGRKRYATQPPFALIFALILLDCNGIIRLTNLDFSCSKVHFCVVSRSSMLLKMNLKVLGPCFIFRKQSTWMAVNLGDEQS